MEKEIQLLSAISERNVENVRKALAEGADINLSAGELGNALKQAHNKVLRLECETLKAMKTLFDPLDTTYANLEQFSVSQMAEAVIDDPDADEKAREIARIVLIDDIYFDAAIDGEIDRYTAEADEDFYPTKHDYYDYYGILHCMSPREWAEDIDENLNYIEKVDQSVTNPLMKAHITKEYDKQAKGRDLEHRIAQLILDYGVESDSDFTPSSDIQSHEELALSAMNRNSLENYSWQGSGKSTSDKLKQIDIKRLFKF